VTVIGEPKRGDHLLQELEHREIKGGPSNAAGKDGRKEGPRETTDTLRLTTKDKGTPFVAGTK